jgi:hypothetical protein
VLRVGRYGEEPRDAVSLCCSLDYDAMTNFATTCLLTHLSKKNQASCGKLVWTATGLISEIIEKHHSFLRLESD